jgi:hypothetical protein
MAKADVFQHIPRAVGAMAGDRTIEDWYQKGLAKLPQVPFATGWSCEAWTRLEGSMRFTAVTARQHGVTSMAPTVVEDAFDMMAQRSPDMKEIETPGVAGGGYGQGKVYQGENARLFVRIGSQGAVLYIVTVGGDGSLDASNQHLRAFFDGFEPLAR